MGNEKDKDFQEKKRLLLKEWKKYRQNIVRPSWDQYFLKIARVISERSMDADTHHGSLIVDEYHRIVGVGYNSFIGGIDDSILPNMRPHKYPFMILHAEINALLNCTKSPRGCTAYTTGENCSMCLQALAQAGIKRIVCGSQKSSMIDEKEQIIISTLKDLLKNKIEFVYYE